MTEPALNQQAEGCSSSPGATRPARRRLALLAVIAAAGALRFGGVDGLPEDWDALDFLLGVGEFDLSRMQPHLPGYPLYMLLATCVSRLGLPPAYALETLGAAAGTATVLVTHQVARTWLNPLFALLVAALLAVQPALVAEAPRMHSDTLGLCVAALSLLFVCRGRPLTGGVFAGLTLGVRLAYAPLVAGLLLFRWVDGRRSVARDGGAAGTGRFVTGTMLGLCAWSVPFLAFHGAEFFAEAAEFLRGHFLDWGGTPFSSESPGLVGAMKRWLVTLAHVMTGSRPTGPIGACWTGLAGVLLVAGGLRALVGSPRRANVSAHGVYWLIVPYLIWLVLGQNPSSFRHALPVALYLTPLAASGWSRSRGGALFVALIVVLCGGSSVSHLIRSRGVPAPADALARYMNEREPSDSTVEVLFCGASYRFLTWRDVEYRVEVRRAVDFSGVRDDVNSRVRVPDEVLVTSEVARLPADSPPMMSFTSPGFLGRRRLDLHRFLVRSRGGLLYELEVPGADTK